MLGISLVMLIGSALLMLRLSPGGSFPSPLSQEEEKKYLTQWQNGDISARNVLVEHNLRLVAHIIKKYYTQTNDIEDLISIGTIGLIKGINTYKPDKGIRLATGDYLCFLNAGDSFHEDDTLQQMVRSISGNELPDVLYGETELVDKEGHFIRMRRLAAPEVLTWRSFKQGMLVCHQAFFAKASLVEPYDLQYRFSADFDWCIRVMKKARTLHNTHLTLIDYLEEGMTTQNRQASLRERFRIMARHYGLASTIAHHAWFVLRAVIKK